MKIRLGSNLTPMTDETFSIFAALGALAAAGALWSQFRVAQLTRRLVRSIPRDQLAIALLYRAAEQLETAKRLLTDDCRDDKQKRKKLREAHSAASEAGRALAAVPKWPELENDVRALVALLEPRPEMALDEQVRVALERLSDIIERARGNLASSAP